MIYKFNDIFNENIYNSAVVFIAGTYNIFNNIVADELKDRSKAIDNIEGNMDTLDEFGLGDASDGGSISISNSVDFNTFLDVVNIPNINGKWYSRVEFKSLSKKQIEKLELYIKNPSKHGILVVVINEYKDYKRYLSNKVIKNSLDVHLIQLNFPSRRILKQIVKKLFQQRGISVDDKAIEFFVMRMSSAYDDYEMQIENIAIRNGKEKITYEKMIEYLKGIENYVLDDFIEKLLEPMNSPKISNRRQIYKMLGALLREMGAKELVNKLAYKIDDYIEFRLAINKGYIPIKVKYSVEEAKNRLGEESKLRGMSDYQFRRVAEIASKTSLRDWLYMKLIINNISNKFNEGLYEKVLYSIVHRTVLNGVRLNNDIGIDNIISNRVMEIDAVKYIERRDSEWVKRGNEFMRQ